MSEFSFKLPDLGEGIVESEIVEWHVNLGDEVLEDQHIADVMTDKAVVEVTAPVTGVVLKLACKAGEVLAVGAELILFSNSIESVDGIESNESGDNRPIAIAPVKASVITDIPMRLVSPDSLTNNKVDNTADNRPILTSPSVRQLARNHQIDLHLVTGTGHAGRISNSDLNNFIAAGGGQMSLPKSLGPQTSTITAVPIKGLRRIVGQKMLTATQNIPHYAYVEEIDLTALEALRQHLNENSKAEQTKLTLLPFIMQALVKVLVDFPHCNAHYDDQAQVLKQYQAAHIGIATMTDKGLLVPVVRHCESLDIWQCAAQLAHVTQVSRAGTAKKELLTGSTITITSLGAIGGIVTTPIINAPETTIIGVNKMQPRAVVRNGEIVVRKMMNISASFDHRIVDGYDGAQLIQALKRLLENPGAIFV